MPKLTGFAKRVQEAHMKTHVDLIRKARATVDNKLPKSLRKRKADVRRERELESRLLKIERENMAFMQKINKIYQQPSYFKTYDTKLKNDNKFDKRRIEMQRVCDENARIAKRLRNAPSHLQPKKWEKDFERHVHMSRHMQGLPPLRRQKRGRSTRRFGGQRGQNNSSPFSSVRSAAQSSRRRSGRKNIAREVLSGPGNTRPHGHDGHGGYSLETRYAGDNLNYRPKGWRPANEGIRALPGRKLESLQPATDEFGDPVSLRRKRIR
eukprot:g562.t1